MKNVSVLYDDLWCCWPKKKSRFRSKVIVTLWWKISKYNNVHWRIVTACDQEPVLKSVHSWIGLMLAHIALLTSLSASATLVSCQRPQTQSHCRCWRKQSGRGSWPKGRVRSPQDTRANQSSARCYCDPSAGGTPPHASWSRTGPEPEPEPRAWWTGPRSDPPLLSQTTGTASSRQLTDCSERKALWVWPLERK